MQHVGKRTSWIIAGTSVGCLALLAWGVAQQAAPAATPPPAATPATPATTIGEAIPNPQDVSYRALEKLAAEVAAADKVRIAESRSIAGDWYSTASRAAMPNVTEGAFRPTFLRLSAGEPGFASLSLVDGSLIKKGAWALTNDGLRTAGQIGDRVIGWDLSRDGQTLTLRGEPFAEAGESFRRIGAGGYNSIVQTDYRQRRAALESLRGYWIGKVPFVETTSDIVVYFGAYQRDPQPRYANPVNLPPERTFQTTQQGTPFRATVYVRTLDGKPLVQVRAMVSSLGFIFSENGYTPGKIRAADTTIGMTYPATVSQNLVQFEGGRQLIPMTEAQFRAYVLAYRGRRASEIEQQAARDAQVRDQLVSRGVPLPVPYRRNPDAKPGAAPATPMPGLPAAAAAAPAAAPGAAGFAPPGQPGPAGAPPSVPSGRTRGGAAEEDDSDA